VSRVKLLGRVYRAAFVVGVLLLLVHGVAAVSHRKIERRAIDRCYGNVKTLEQAFALRVADGQQTAPPGPHWCDELALDVTDTAAFLCPASVAPVCGYALNSLAGGQRPSKLADAGATVRFFESDMGWNAVGGPELLPDIPRHLGGDLYGFVDGHVQWLARKKKSDGTWAKEPEADWVIWEPVFKESEREVSEADEAP